MYNQYESFKKYKVNAASVEDFLNKFYKYDRFYGRGQDYVEELINNYKEEFENNGFCCISHHDSKTGEVVAYYG